MSKLKIAIAAVLVIVLIVVAVLLLTGGDDEDSSSDNAKNGQSSGGGDDDDSGDDDSDSDAPPPLKTIGLKRSEGPNATAAAGGIIDKPKLIYLRVSAAPKQKVKGSWNVSCGGGNVDMDAFEATPPYLLKLRIPRKNADSCVAGASAQLSGEGRLKVAILRDR